MTLTSQGKSVNFLSLLLLFAAEQIKYTNLYTQRRKYFEEKLIDDYIGDEGKIYE